MLNRVLLLLNILKIDLQFNNYIITQLILTLSKNDPNFAIRFGNWRYILY